MLLSLFIFLPAALSASILIAVCVQCIMVNDKMASASFAGY
jgi:hypothetical protein